jgi:MoxR-like ATPase
LGYRHAGLTLWVIRMVTSTSTKIDPRTKLLRLEQELNQSFFEREELVRIVLLSLLTRQHTLVFGKHGAAKSSLIRAVASALSCCCFTIQLGKDTPRDEMFGPIKVSKLPEDKLCRAYENFMPGKPLVFLDEIDKANSIILNGLYTAMEERMFLDDGVMRPMPLISLFGAANNISQLQTEALAPLLDRFLFRIEVDWLQSDSNFLEFVRRNAEQDAPVLTTSMTLSELNALQLEVQQVSFPRTVQESVTKLRKDLATEGIFASDRRWGYIISLLKAIAFVEGDEAVGEEHFKPLRHVLWSDKRQISEIDKILKSFDQGLSPKLKSVLQSATTQAEATLRNQDPQTLLAQATLTISDLQALRDELSRLPINSKVRQVITTIEKKIGQIEVHRQAVCHV